MMSLHMQIRNEKLRENLSMASNRPIVVVVVDEPVDSAVNVQVRCFERTSIHFAICCMKHTYPYM